MADPRPSIASFFRQNAALFILGLAHVPFLIAYLIGLWRVEHYQFFPFAFAVLIGLYVSRVDRGSVRIDWPGRAALFLDLLLLAAAILINSPEFAAMAFVMYCFAVTRGSREWLSHRAMTSLTLLPLIVTRPPRRLDVEMIHWLQEKTTWLASSGLENLGYLHLRRGNVIEFPGHTFLVEEACSGVQSLFTVLFLAALTVCWFRRGLIHSMLLIGLGLLFAAAMNILRIGVIAVAWQNWELDLAIGWQHDVIGYAVLLFAALLLVSADALLNFFLSPFFTDMPYGQLTETYHNPFTSLWNFIFGFGGGVVKRRRLSETTSAPGIRLLSLSACAAFTAAAVVFQGVLMYASGLGLFKLPESSLAVFKSNTLPAEIEGFQVSKYETTTRSNKSNWGEYSNTWRLTGHGMNLLISCDHPFINWHYLNICYTGAGWEVSPSITPPGSMDWPFVSFSLTDQAAGRQGTVIYSLFYADGEQLNPPATSFSLRYIFERIRNRSAGGLISVFRPPKGSASFQLQLFVESVNPISEQQKELLESLFVSVRTLLHEHYLTNIHEQLPRQVVSSSLEMPQ